MTDEPESSSMRERAWEGVEGLRAQAPAWAEVLSASGADPVFNSPTWSEAYAQAWVDDADVFGWILEDGAGAPLAVLPFRREPRSIRTTSTS
jgi:hypothetical protein